MIQESQRTDFMETNLDKDTDCETGYILKFTLYDGGTKIENMYSKC